MDLDAILARRPEVALVDELAHTNVPGSRHEKRWQDVEAAARRRDHGDLDAQRPAPRVASTTSSSRSPASSSRRRSPTRSCVGPTRSSSSTWRRRRSAAGWPTGTSTRPSGSTRRSGTTSAPATSARLRELALLWVADRVDDALLDYRERHGIDRPWETRERVVVALTGSRRRRAPCAPRGPHGRARRRATSSPSTFGRRTGSPAAPPICSTVSASSSSELGGTYREVVGADIGEALVATAAHAERDPDRPRRDAPVAIHRADARIGDQPRDPRLRRRPRRARHQPRGRRKRGRRRPREHAAPALCPGGASCSGFVLAAVGLPLLTWLLSNLRTELGLPSVLLLFLLLVVAISAVGGVWPALWQRWSASYWSTGTSRRRSTRSRSTRARTSLPSSVFLAVAAVVSTFVSLAARRAADGARARAEAEALAGLAGAGAGRPSARRPAPRPRARRRRRAPRRRTAAGRFDHGGGRPCPDEPDDGRQVELDDDPRARSRRAGRSPRARTIAILERSPARSRRRSRSRSSRRRRPRPGRSPPASELRTAISQPFPTTFARRSPAIKASVTSLLQDDVDWTPEARHEFLVTIDEESDRLNALVGNLLDMSRLQTGALDVSLVRGRGRRGDPGGAREHRPARRTSRGRRRRDATRGCWPTRAARTRARERDRATPSTTARPTSRCASPRARRGDAVDVRVVDRGPGLPAGDATGSSCRSSASAMPATATAWDSASPSRKASSRQSAARWRSRTRPAAADDGLPAEGSDR